MPGISVVVASNRSPELLEACLASLDQQRGASEVIVVRAGAPDRVASSVRNRPHVKVVPAPADASIPFLRGLGIERATGDAVAVTEDHCVAAPGWIEELQRGLAGGADVVGGGMGNARTSSAVDWAAYFSEYGFFSSTRPAATEGVPLVTGANVAYAASVRAEVAAWARGGMWEDVIHGRLHAQGAVFAFRPAARILQNRTYSFADFCIDRFQHGHDFARMRLREQGSGSRWLRLIASPALSMVLLSRVARSAAGEDRGAFVRSLPVTFAFLTAWTIGELVGYARGAAATGRNP